MKCLILFSLKKKEKYHRSDDCHKTSILKVKLKHLNHFLLSFVFLNLDSFKAASQLVVSCFVCRKQSFHNTLWYWHWFVCLY